MLSEEEMGMQSANDLAYSAKQYKEMTSLIGFIIKLKQGAEEIDELTVD